MSLHLSPLYEVAGYSAKHNQQVVDHDYSGRAVFILDKQIVLKRYTRSTKNLGTKKWEIEHRALVEVAKLDPAAQVSHGYVSDKDFVYHYKSYVAGTEYKSLTKASVSALAKCIKTIHKAGVITRDVNSGNIVETNTGEYVFIDFGRARTFARKGLRFRHMQLTELLQVQRNLFAKDSEGYRDFWRHYFEGRQAALYRLLPLLQGSRNGFYWLNMCRKAIRKSLRIKGKYS